jgi:hypothetical protein
MVLCQIVLQHAHDVINGAEKHTLDDEYMVLLKHYAQSSLKFKLFLFATKKLDEKELSEEDKHVVK